MWLSICDEKHTTCHLKTAGLFVPTRLIDVARKDSTDMIYLVMPDAASSVQYLALSHPWGGNHSHHMKTTSAVLDSYTGGIPIDRLPPTFRDAVRATRELGIRYLWIDSLCTIQDSQGDWLTEAGCMEEVFQHAYCVISATCATGQESGFLRDDQPQRPLVTFNRKPEEHFYICKLIDDFSTDVSQSKLYQRGWVLSERVMARRTVFFTASQTYFECGDGIRCGSFTKMFT